MKLEKKKVMLLNFPLLDVGGITTWAHQIRKGFENIGFETDHYYCNRTGRFKCEEDEFIPIGDKYKRGEKVPSKTLGFNGDKYIKEFIKLQEQYDYVIFVHPSPHPNKGNRNTPGMDNWKMLYENCNIPSVVIFHDMKWRKTNKWFEDVHPYIDIILAAQHNFIESVDDYATLSDERIITDWLYFPIDMDGVGLIQEKQNELCMMSQWIKWKNHDKLLEVADKLFIPIHFYNGGMEYHKIAKKDIWKNTIRFDHVEDLIVNDKSLHEYHGFVSYDIVKEVYKRSLGCIDMTKRTYQNYTHHESSLYGCTILCTEECRKGPYNHIPDGTYWPIDLNDIEKSINAFIGLPELYKNEIRYKAYTHVRENFECSKIAMKINSIVESLTI